MNTIRFLLSVLGASAFTLLLTGRAAAQSSFDKALSLDGSNPYVTVPSAVWLNGSFTVESWVYVRSTQPFARLMDFGNGAGLDVVYCTLSSGATGQPGFGGYNPGGTEMDFVTAPAPLPLNTWTHLAFT